MHGLVHAKLSRTHLTKAAAENNSGETLQKNKPLNWTRRRRRKFKEASKTVVTVRGGVKKKIGTFGWWGPWYFDHN